MAIQRVQQVQRSWTTPLEHSTVENFLSFAESLPPLDGHAPSSPPSVTLSGSASGVKVEGTPAEVRKDLEQLDDREFVNASVNAPYPLPSNPRVSVSLNLGTRLINSTIQPVDPPIAAPFFDQLRDQFPRDAGPSEEELDRRATELESLLKEAEALRRSRAQVGHLEEKAEEQVKEVERLAGEISKREEEANQNRDATKEAVSQAESNRDTAKTLRVELETIKQEAQQQLDSAEKSQGRISALEGAISEFHAEIKKKQTKLNDQIGRSQEIVEKHGDLQSQVDDQLQRAAGGALFEAFSQRKDELAETKKFWARGVWVAVILEIAAIVWLALEAAGDALLADRFVQPMFLLKVAITLPLIYLIWFTAQQYRRERDREEVYAFKAALSLSLRPYLGVISDMRKAGASDDEIALAVQTIIQVFENPLRLDEEEVEHLLEGAGNTISGVVKDLGSFAKTVGS